jgi:nicotinamidase-related amidase
VPLDKAYAGEHEKRHRYIILTAPETKMDAISSDDTVHLCIDMQRIFGPGGVWETPWMERVLPNVVRIVERRPEQTVFTRFFTPFRPDEVPGTWRLYYEKWRAATREHLDGDMLELMPPLQRFAPPARVIDKLQYSAFTQTDLLALLIERGARRLVVTGSETDVCVLATVLSAIDLGFHVSLVEDAICSSSDQGHDNLLEIYRGRYSVQIQTITTGELLAVW